jgi:hypothetical protein
MNFDQMPELHWLLGYPLALLLMVVTSTGPVHGVQTPRLALARRFIWRPGRGAN